MKVIAVLFILIGIAGYVTYEFGIKDFDPEKQAADFNAMVQPGMTWQEVADVFEPKKFRIYDMNAVNGTSGPIKYDAKTVQSYVEKGNAGFGFQFDYVFSGKHAYSVSFDSEGVVTYVNKERTAADLFQGKPMVQ